MTSQPNLFDAFEDLPPDEAAREFARDPANHVVLEASAGTGKTRVLADRYLRLIEQNVDPRNILAITFTRKAAAEMRERVLSTLRDRAQSETTMATRWRALRERLTDIQISTIDAFCFNLLREFPLEAQVDPAFEVADETEMARFQNEALDLTLRAARGLIATDENVRLVFARVKLPVLRDALAMLIDRRHVAVPAVKTFVDRKVRHSTSAEAGEAFLAELREIFRDGTIRSGIVDDGPAGSPEFSWLQRDLQQLHSFPASDAPLVRQLYRRLERYFLTKNGDPRQRLLQSVLPQHFRSADARGRHEAAVRTVAPRIANALVELETSVNGLLARGLMRVLAITVDRYQQLLDEHALLDFPGMLAKSVALLKRQEEFARSRLKLQSRFHHVLVDEFQDTSRLQWQLIEQLIDAWAEGEGAAGDTSVFIVGDRKQSIYRFRHAEVTLLDEAARKISALRPGRDPRKAITRSYRAVPALQAFVNALAEGMLGDAALDDRFRYDERDRFIVTHSTDSPAASEPVVGLIAEPSMEAQAASVADEIGRLLASGTVRGKDGRRPVRAEDIAILFRARTGHQLFEAALDARGIPTYVYKGLGFFDAPEVQDLQALIRFLAQPESNLRAAEFLRSRFVRLSDSGLVRLAPAFADGLTKDDFDVARAGLNDVDAKLLTHARRSLRWWLPAVDRITPSEVLDRVLTDSAYMFELRGRRLDQARENLKKLRAVVRKVENRGYATIGRLADYFDTLRTGEESNAVVEAAGCVSLMTIHAAKGLEFPIVFVVNLHMQGRLRPPGFSVIERGPDGQPEVAFNASEGTKLEDRREMEELRRVMYVAVTRARDRLYLAGEIDRKGELKRAARSLASLLPVTLAEQFGAAARGDGEEIEWTNPNETFVLRVCRRAAEATDASAGRDANTETPETLEPLIASGVVRAASETSSTPATAQPHALPDERPLVELDGRLIGTVVHRMFRRFRATMEPLDVAAVSDLLRPDERAQIDDLTHFCEIAGATFSRFRETPGLISLLTSGRCEYEVPFSIRASEESADVVRGRIDCVVISPDGSVTAIELKTGAARSTHAGQLTTYVDALRDIFPGREIDGKIVYPRQDT